ncbi:MAG: hypothetical protein FWD05_10955 [Oscillospiraceae bacterium]|nr:hypothetical protein [Oscillospiraceae bacterium]
MNKKLIKYLTNPAKNKLVRQVLSEGQTTAKALAEKNENIPQATLYRYLKKMVADGVLKVVEERRVRNVIEKVYALGIDFDADVNKMIEENDGETYLGLFQQFTIGLLDEYSAYCARDDIDILNDGSGFRVLSFNATTDELKELAANIWKQVEPYAKQKVTPERKTRSLAVIFTPPPTTGAPHPK